MRCQQISHHLVRKKKKYIDDSDANEHSLRHQSCPWIYYCANIKERIKSLENKQTSWKINNIEQIKRNTVMFHSICVRRVCWFSKFCWSVELDIFLMKMAHTIALLDVDCTRRVCMFGCERERVRVRASLYSSTSFHFQWIDGRTFKR